MQKANNLWDFPKGKYSVAGWEELSCGATIAPLTYSTGAFIAPPKQQHPGPIVVLY